MVDITKSLRPTAIKLGVAENIKFVKSNLYAFYLDPNYDDTY